MIGIPGGLILVPDSVSSLHVPTTVGSVRVCPGLAKALTDEDLKQPWCQGVARTGEIPASEHRDFDVAVRDRLRWAVRRGLLGRGARWDDRKFRFHSAGLAGAGARRELVLELGPSHFPEHLASNGRAMADPLFRDQLLALGSQKYGDPFAYYANCLAVNVVVRTADDMYVIGIRAGSQRFFPGRAHAIGGFVDAIGIEEVTAEEFERESLGLVERAAARELFEELGLEAAALSDYEILGVSLGPSSVDVNLSVECLLAGEEVMRRASSAEDRSEHHAVTVVSLPELVNMLCAVVNVAGDGGGRALTETCTFVPTGFAGFLLHVARRDAAGMRRILLARCITDMTETLMSTGGRSNSGITLECSRRPGV